MSEDIVPPIVAGFSDMTKADTTTCDACGTCYAFTSNKDGCPVCCPVQEADESESEQTDLANHDDG
jgi:hypothetical protein